MNAVLKVLGLVLGTILVIFLWYKASWVIVALLDLNLQGIKWVCGPLPAPYGSMAESALRVGLNADKALVLAEGAWFVTGVLRLIFYSGRSGRVAVPHH